MNDWFIMPRKDLINFNMSWLNDSIDGTKNALWLKRNPSEIGLGMCTICPKPNTFNIKQGYKSVRQHFNTKKHQENLVACQTDPSFKQVMKINVSPLNYIFYLFLGMELKPFFFYYFL